jgi:hypothetical protein
MKIETTDADFEAASATERDLRIAPTALRA